MSETTKVIPIPSCDYKAEREFLTSIEASGEQLEREHEQRITKIKVHLAALAKSEANVQLHQEIIGIELFKLKDEFNQRKRNRGLPGNYDLPLGLKNWNQFVRLKFNLSQERADELIRIATGKTTVEKVREGTKRRVQKHRSVSRDTENKSVLRNTENKSVLRNTENKSAKSTAWEGLRPSKLGRALTDDELRAKYGDTSIPTETECEQEEQQGLYDHACEIVDQMSHETRRKFFGYIKRKYENVA